MTVVLTQGDQKHPDPPDWKTRLPLASILLDTKFFDIRIKDELFTRDQRNVQETPVTFKSLSRNALNKDMSFE